MNVRIRVLTAAPSRGCRGGRPAQTWASASSPRATASSPEAMIGFASSIALQGNDLYVGRTGAAQGFPMPPTTTGAVHVFTRNSAGTWVESVSFAGSDVKLNDGFGSSLAVDGSLVAVGAPTGDRWGHHVREEGDGLGPGGEAVGGGRQEGDDFGRTVALKGGMLASGHQPVTRAAARSTCPPQCKGQLVGAGTRRQRQRAVGRHRHVDHLRWRARAGRRAGADLLQQQPGPAETAHRRGVVYRRRTPADGQRSRGSAWARTALSPRSAGPSWCRASRCSSAHRSAPRRWGRCSSSRAAPTASTPRPPGCFHRSSRTSRSSGGASRSRVTS